MDEKAVALEFAKFELQYALHHEQMRERMTALILIISGASLAAVGWDRSIQPSDFWFGLGLVLLGAFGVLFSLKHHERWAMHYERFRSFRRALSDQTDGLNPEEIRLSGHRTHQNTYFSKAVQLVPLEALWAAIPVFVLIIGIVIAVLSR